MIPISSQVLALAAKILIITQAIKRIFDIGWLSALLEKWTGIKGFAGGASVVLAGAVGLVAGVIQYGSDGSLSWEDVQTIVSAVITAVGGFAAMKSWLSPKTA